MSLMSPVTFPGVPKLPCALTKPIPQAIYE